MDKLNSFGKDSVSKEISWKEFFDLMGEDHGLTDFEDTKGEVYPLIETRTYSNGMVTFDVGISSRQTFVISKQKLVDPIKIENGVIILRHPKGKSWKVS